jgi:hypothetical protein
MQNAYDKWIGQTVILELEMGEVQTPLSGIIVGESEQSVRFRVNGHWEIDIYKSMILGVTSGQ